MNVKFNFYIAIIVTYIPLIFSPSIYAKADNFKGENEYFEMDITELLELEITSVSKRAEKAFHAPAAVFVITQQDIKRSGVTNIPEALRMAPGIDVAKIDGNKWAISSRGFINRFANKLLILMDGRTVYNPFASGTYWDVQDTLLEDIHRIEVIRGSGASVWGANAVNGVINIITKSASDTKGTYLSAGGGTKERVFTGLRHGGSLTEKVDYRIYAKYFDRENNDDVFGQPVNDDWRMGRGGFRIDGRHTQDDQFTLQGDVYQGEVGETTTLPNLVKASNDTLNTDTQVVGGNILMRWQHQLNETDSTQAQLYYDYVQRESIWLGHEFNTLDLDFQHNFSTFANQNIIWGAGYRFISDDFDDSTAVDMALNQHDYHVFNIFFQDEISLFDDELKIIFGSKFEHNDFSGVEIQPSAHFMWTAHEQHRFWGSISRAVWATPRGAAKGGVTIKSPFDLSGAKPTLTSINTDLGRRSEQLIAYELGYRFSMSKSFSADLALFYYDYDEVRSIQPAGNIVDKGSYNVIPVSFVTNTTAEAYGAEIDFKWQLLDNWQMSANYSYQNQELHVSSGSLLTEEEEKQTLNHKFSIRSSFNLTSDLDWDVWFKYAWIKDLDELTTVPLAPHLRDLLTLDTRVTWRPTQNIELSVVGQNLINKQQIEYYSSFVSSASSQVERSVYGKIEFRF